MKAFSITVGFLEFTILEFTIFVYKLLELTIDSSYNSSSFQKKIVISVAASPLNKGWFKIQQKTLAPYSLQFLGLHMCNPRVSKSSSLQSSSFGTENCKL